MRVKRLGSREKADKKGHSVRSETDPECESDSFLRVFWHDRLLLHTSHGTWPNHYSEAYLKAYLHSEQFKSSFCVVLVRVIRGKNS
jgi:hypothetical protein